MKPIDTEFADYVRARQHQLLRVATLMCGDPHRAEDLVQTALEKLATRWSQVGPGNPDAFLRTVIYRDSVSTWRRTRREHLSLVSEFETDAAQRPVPADTVDEVANRRIDLQRALMQLTQKQRAVLVLRFYEDRSEAETADALGVSVGTVKSQTHAALARLRELAPELAPAFAERT